MFFQIDRKLWGAFSRYVLIRSIGFGRYCTYVLLRLGI